MDAAATLETLRGAGLRVRLGGSNTLKVTPAALLTPELRALIQGHKHDLVLALALATLANDHDTRATCTTCRHLRTGNRCNNHRRAALTTRELAADFTLLRQHCHGFALAVAHAPH
jgi:hypothetical protein